MIQGPISVRLRDLEPASEERARKVRDLLRGCSLPEPLSPAAVESIHARIVERPAQSERLLRPALALAAAAGVALALGALLAHRDAPLAVSREPAAGRTAAPSRPAVVERTDKEEASGRGREPRVTAPGPRRAPVLAPSSVKTEGAMPPPHAANEDGLARESQALSSALAALRRDHDPQAALVALDRYSAEFPRGQLAQEAMVARVDALLALGRRSEARQLLEQLPLETLPRSVELRLIRAELRGTAGDCAGANLDYARVLAANPAPALRKRAELGRARCHAPDQSATEAQEQGTEQP